MLKALFATVVGKLTIQAIRILRMGSATSLPGKLALWIEPTLLAHLGRQVKQKTVAITGTNGKSTTAGLLSIFVGTKGVQVVHNQLGANMVSGIATALMNSSTLMGHLKADYAILEVDEASMPAVCHEINWTVTVSWILLPV
jgi:UDP-N-acetylmuramyl tripeptide synthase